MESQPKRKNRGTKRSRDSARPVEDAATKALVFITWSGQLSLSVAQILRQYLPLIFQNLEVFMSDEDIRSGTRWPLEMARALELGRFGILCLTPDNLHEDWILFEAGALTKHIEDRACGVLIGGLKPADVKGPLAQFQHRSFEEADFGKLAGDINRQLAKPLDSETLRATLEKWWPEIHSNYENATQERGLPRPVREEKDILEEMLLRVRDLQRTVQVGTKRRVAFVNATISDAGVTAETPGALVVKLVIEGKEYTQEIRKPGTDYQPIILNLLRNVQVPIEGVRAYEGGKLVYQADFFPRMSGEIFVGGRRVSADPPW